MKSKVLTVQHTEPDLEDVELQSAMPATAIMSLELGKSAPCPKCKTLLHLLLFHSGALVPCHRCEHMVRVP